MSINTPRRGLTLGKFAPLHKGHQFLIETALSEMDEIAIIIYDCPEMTNVPLNVRADWIRKLYPQVQVIEAWDGPAEVGDTPEIRLKHEDYILNRLRLSGFTHFYSSEFYGEHMSQALGAVNRIVDEARSRVPVAATQIRTDPFAWREYLDNVVYRDLVTNVAILGAPSTGKTTLAERLAREFDTCWMPEYGREYWEKHQVERRLSTAQLIEIAEGHLEREEAMLQRANRYLFTDTNVLTTCMFSHHYHGTVPPRLEELARGASERYDLHFLCDEDIPYDDTWDRSGEADRHTFQKLVISDLLRRKIPYFVLRGSLKSRVDRAREILSQFRKYENPVSFIESLCDLKRERFNQG